MSLSSHTIPEHPLFGLALGTEPYPGIHRDGETLVGPGASRQDEGLRGSSRCLLLLLLANASERFCAPLGLSSQRLSPTPWRRDVVLHLRLVGTRLYMQLHRAGASSASWDPPAKGPPILRPSASPRPFEAAESPGTGLLELGSSPGEAGSLPDSAVGRILSFRCSPGCGGRPASRRARNLWSCQPSLQDPLAQPATITLPARAPSGPPRPAQVTGDFPLSLSHPLFREQYGN